MVLQEKVTNLTAVARVFAAV